MQTNIETFPSGGNWKECFEGAFLRNYFECLQVHLGEDFFAWTFHILHHNLAVRPIDLPFFGKRHVLLWFSDESAGPAVDASVKFEHVFKCYSLPDPHPKNVHPFPLFGSSAVFGQPALPIGKRKYGAFFSGNLNRNRVPLFVRLAFPALDTLPSVELGSATLSCLAAACRVLNGSRLWRISLPSSFIQFNHGFAKGLPPDDYALRLANTRICLCPPGFITSETMRHFEAMKLGCVILSAKLPPSPFYKNSPIIQMPSWRGIRRTVAHLLQDEDKLAQVSTETNSWWQKHCSPEAAARETAKVLKVKNS